MRTISELRSCEFCEKAYSLEDDIFNYESFGSKFVDCLYPNLFICACPKCFRKVFNDYRRGSTKTRLSRLYDLFLFTGKIPTQDFEQFIYLYRDPDSLRRLFEIFKKMRTPYGYKEECGSFFAALVKSGIIPEGSRRMAIGALLHKPSAGSLVASGDVET